ncbi:RHS repeat protein, partial [Candidatus Poribacteria bacterium]|nr:RHS repeat protein [Candidatus Poribacteria bacterium]
METQTNTIDLRNIVTEYQYNSATHQLEQVTRESETLASFTYDTAGRVSTRTDASGIALTYEYNDLNKVTRVTYPDGRFESYTYSDCCPHLLDSVTDRAGRTTHYIHNPLKRLIATIDSESGITARYVYDADGNLIKLIDPNGHGTRFEYDVVGRLIKEIYADNKFLTLAYDAAGLLARRTNARGATIDYTYDQNHNLLSVNYSDFTPDVTYEYDDYNRMTRRTDGIGTWQYAYDANSRLATVDGPWTDDTLTYHYDDLGRRVMLEQQGGQAIDYDYDDFNRLTGIQVGTNVYSYGYLGANPLVQSLSRPNGSVTTYQYDTLKRLTAISNLYSTNPLDIINKFEYAYGDATHPDLRSSETITNGNPITSFQNELITYNYNNVNQLLSSTNPSQAFTYDDDGNMTQGYTPEGYVFSADYDAENRLKT